MSVRERFGKTRDSLQAGSHECIPGLVSVVVPCFNSADYLRQSIDSALRQTHPQVEVIVVDDGSTDASPRIIESYGTKIRAVRRANGGACAARNDGLEIARGEFVQFLDADDFLMRDAIENRLGAFRPEVDVVFGERLHVDEQGRETKSEFRRHGDVGWHSQGQLSYILFSNISTIEPLHRVEAVRSVGGFDEGFSQGQEPDFHMRLYLSGARFEYVPTVVAAQRHHFGVNRIRSGQWWVSDPERFVDVARHWIRLIGENAPDEMTQALRDAFAGMLCQRAIQASMNGAKDVARLCHDEALAISPGYVPIGAFGRVSRVVGLWNAIRVGAWRRRFRGHL